MKTLYVSGQGRYSKIRKIVLLKYIKRKSNKYKCIVVGKKLKEDLKLIESINNMEIPIADGRWLFKFLVIQIIEYISKCQNIDIQKQRIAIVSNDNNDLINYYVKELMNKNNRLRIITEHKEKFYNMEEALYYENGIVLAISNNKRKGLQDSDIIFNFDFTEEGLNKYRIPENAIIVNLKGKININAKRFSGINISSYRINFKNRLMDMLEWTNDFEKTELYESYIYRNDKIENIAKDILKDKVIIESLLGNNGEIARKEYKNVLDKTSYLS